MSLWFHRENRWVSVVTKLGEENPAVAGMMADEEEEAKRVLQKLQVRLWVKTFAWLLWKEDVQWSGLGRRRTGVQPVLRTAWWEPGGSPPGRDSSVTSSVSTSGRSPRLLTELFRSPQQPFLLPLSALNLATLGEGLQSSSPGLLVLGFTLLIS